mmetsp:Transcript_11863/g.24471  ORF Transcript_11863/g.24471 Transcript_11863/m.24471 type:complete len:402 (-) Transcript_11863:673-1878(-)
MQDFYNSKMGPEFNPKRNSMINSRSSRQPSRIVLVGITGVVLAIVSISFNFITNNAIWISTQQSLPVDRQPISRFASPAEVEGQISYPPEPDLRTAVVRPFMEATSHTIIDSFYDIERRYKPTEECDLWGGTKFIQELNQSVINILSPKEGNYINQTQSTIDSYKLDNVKIFYAENVSVVINMSMPYGDSSSLPYFQLEINGKLNSTNYNERMKISSVKKNKGTVLERMGHEVSETNGPVECSEILEYPVMLVDSSIDTWNWWFFLQTILHHYVALGIVQPMIAGKYKSEPMRVLFTTDDHKSSRSFLDAFEFLFSDGRERDSRQVWKVGSNTTNGEKRYCFKKLLWAPKNSIGGRLLVNHKHAMGNCFSSIVYSYAAYLKAAMHIPTLPRPEQPRIVWVG